MNEFSETAPVQVYHHEAAVSVVLNRPRSINSLTREMIRIITEALRGAMADGTVGLVLLYGRGERGFCAGGDIRELYAAALKDDRDAVEGFFREEYALDEMIHDFPKPVIVIADGVTMGGGLGLAAGADVVVATERTLIAMPETRIGFFPDVGATGWLFAKCPPGYPEFLGLTGYEMRGGECVRLGLADCLVDSARIPDLLRRIESLPRSGSPAPEAALRFANDAVSHYRSADIPANPEMDSWVNEYFQGRESLTGILDSLRRCPTGHDLCRGVFERISERSPTALLLTHRLLRRNEDRPLPEVFRTELRAALYITAHHDYIEGVRARIIDRDNLPRWQPASLDEAGLDGLEL